MNRNRGGQRGGYNGPRYGNFKHRGGPFNRRRGGQEEQPKPAHVPDYLRLTWNKITVLHLKEYGRGFLFDQLPSFVQATVHPVLFQIETNGDGTFFIEDNDVAQAIESRSGCIVAPNGQSLVITLTKCDPPFVPLNPSDVEAIKKALQSRYEPITEHINLSTFIDDPKINQTGNYLSLTKNNVMMAVVNLLGDSYPNLKSIDLSKNRLRFLDFFAGLQFQCPHVERLLLPYNMIDELNELDKLFRWNLIELDLTENPVRIKFRDNTLYFIVAIRQLLPKLTRLDGVDLPPEFETGIEDYVKKIKLAPTAGNCFVGSDNLKELCEEFVKNYFTIFDGATGHARESLFDFYDERAVFTMSAVNLKEFGSRSRSPAWSQFLRDSHNIKLIHIWRRYWAKLVHHGQDTISAYFAKNYPLTRHDFKTFVIDASTVTETLISLNVSGLYKDRSSTPTDSLRSFTRAFLLTQKGSGSDTIEECTKNGGLVIVNDELFVTTLSNEQETSYRSQVDQLQTWSGVVPENQPEIEESVDHEMAPISFESVRDEHFYRTDYSSTKRKRESDDVEPKVTYHHAKRSLDVLRKYVEENAYKFSDNVCIYFNDIESELTKCTKKEIGKQTLITDYFATI